METNSFSELTEKCQNFKDYLKNSFEVDNYGNFVGAYKFPLTQINELVAAATTENATPTSLRVYYGCDTDGKNHRLFLGVLDEQDNVLQVQSLQESQIPSATAGIMFTAPSAKCPPGCVNDVILQSLI